MVRPDDAELSAALLHLGKLRCHASQGLCPGGRLELPVDPDQRRRQAVRMRVEVERVASFDAEKLAIDARAVAIIGAYDLAVAQAQRRLASVRTMRADGAHMFHFPRPCLVTVSAAGQRAHRADVDAFSALVALEMVAVAGHDLRQNAAVADAQRAHAHPLVADPDAAVTENAARRIVENHRRPLLFIDVLLGFNKPALARSIAEHHVLQLALATLVADRAIE